MKEKKKKKRCKLADRCQEQLEGYLFKSYYTEVLRIAGLLLDPYLIMLSVK